MGVLGGSGGGGLGRIKEAGEVPLGVGVIDPDGEGGAQDEDGEGGGGF